MKLTELKNIGKEMERKLNVIGINNAEELKKAGSKDVYFRLKYVFPEVCLVHLYTIQGAIDDIEYNKLPNDVKKDLKEFSDQFK